MATFLLGLPGVGKTRLAGIWPRPLWLNGEPDGNTSAIKGGQKPDTIDIMMSRNAIDKLTSHVEALAKLEPDDDGMIEYHGRKFGSVVWDSFDAFQDIAKANIQRGTGLTHMRPRDWGTLETLMREPLLFLGLIKVPTVVIGHVKIKDAEGDKIGRMWWSAQGGITRRLNRLASEILHVFVNQDNEHFVASEPFIFNGYELLAKDRHNKLRPLANKYGLVNIEGDDDYPPRDIAEAIIGRELGKDSDEQR